MSKVYLNAPLLHSTILGSVISLFLFSSAFAQDAVTKATPTCSYGNIKVTRVIDGGTLELENGERVCLIGIDCPESKSNKKAMKDSQRTQQDLEAITKMGKEAKEFAKNLVEGNQCRLEFDVQKKDRYGRLLAYVWRRLAPESEPFPIPHPEGIIRAYDGWWWHMINGDIVRSGYAQPMTVPPNLKYAELFEKLYKEARENKRGLWKDSIQKKEGDSCNSNYECATIDCLKHDTPVKEGYQPYCVKDKCKCMCYGCE